MDKINKRQYHLYTDTVLLDTFNRLYEGAMRRFLTNALKLANNDRSFFESVYFMDIDRK